MNSKPKRDPAECNTCPKYHNLSCPLKAYREDCFVLYFGEFNASPKFRLPPKGLIEIVEEQQVMQGGGNGKIKWARNLLTR